MLDYSKLYVEKIHSINAELAGHAHKLDMILQRLCGSGFFLFAVGMLATLGELTNTTFVKIKINTLASARVRGFSEKNA